MELVGRLAAFEPRGEADAAAAREGVEKLLVLLAPFVPHVVEELWEETGHRESICRERWPSFDLSAAAEEEVTLVVQVNGKVRARMQAPASVEEEAMRKLALEDPRVRQWTEGKTVAKVIVVPGKLVNIVVR
jgi:leucyl-tRNA synthetase